MSLTTIYNAMQGIVGKVIDAQRCQAQAMELTCCDKSKEFVFEFRPTWIDRQIEEHGMDGAAQVLASEAAKEVSCDC